MKYLINFISDAGTTGAGIYVSISTTAPVEE